MSIHRVAGVDMIDAMRSHLAQPARDHVEGFGARMGVHRCLGLRRSGPLVETQQILGRGDCRQGPDLGDLAAPGVEASLGPSVTTQILPATSAISDVVVSYRTEAGFQPSVPTAAFASASVGKFSTARSPILGVRSIIKVQEEHLLPASTGPK